MNSETIEEDEALGRVIALLRKRRYAEAEASASDLTAFAPSARALHVLAECHLARGALGDAATDRDSALALKPEDPGLWVGRADLELWRDGFAGWEKIVDCALSVPVLPPAVFHFLVRKACLLWIRRREALCASVISHLTQALGRDGNTLALQLRGYTMSMAGHLNGLIRAERAGRGGRYDARATLPKLYLVGDSHCISPAATVVSFTGRPHRVTPVYVLGCKAWHLTTAFPNPYKEAVLRAARTIPTGSEVIFTAGDIDCRFESGFHNLYRKTGAALDRAIDQTVAAYLDQLRTLFPAERHRLSILAPPAQRGDLGRFGGPDLALLADIGRLFHETLSVGCNARGLALIDYYAMTAGSDGFANPSFHVDGHHLSADALRLALA